MFLPLAPIQRGSRVELHAAWRRAIKGWIFEYIYDVSFRCQSLRIPQTMFSIFLVCTGKVTFQTEKYFGVTVCKANSHTMELK
jgi:hypothetical protein